MSEEQSVKKEVSFQEIASKLGKKYAREMRSSFVLAGIFMVLSITAICLLLAFQLPTWGFVLLFVLCLIFVLLTLAFVHDTGRFYEIKDYEPRAWIKEGQYKKLEKNFVEMRDSYSAQLWHLTGTHWAFCIFVRQRSPELAAEFAARVKEQQSSDEESKKEEKPLQD
jgi:Ca2+/Na+ antiporter